MNPSLANTFELDARLAADSLFVADGPLSQVRLMDDALARSLLGFKAKLSLAEGLKRTLDWYRNDPASPARRAVHRSRRDRLRLSSAVVAYSLPSSASNRLSEINPLGEYPCLHFAVLLPPPSP